jgi:hypothetical protein
LYFEKSRIIRGRKIYKEVIRMTGTITVILVFSIPLVAIITSHFQKQTKMKQEMLKDELELERLKNQNYLIETEKMKLELEKMTIEQKSDLQIK